MTDETARMASYEICLTLSGLPAGSAEEVQHSIAQALAGEVPDSQVSINSVLELYQLSEEGWIREQIASLDTLFLTLPKKLQTPTIRIRLAAHYHAELNCLWRSVTDTRCVRGVVALHPWRRAGSQWICEFMSYDLGAPLSNEFNFHLQNTSQWQNRATGWTGHQGAIVLDSHSGEISAHH